MITKVFIPYSEDRPISQKVLDSINIDIIKIDCTYDKKIPKLQRIIMAENCFKETALKETCDFYVYNQSDIIHTQSDNFTVMQAFLTSHPNFGAVALSRHTISNNAILVYNKNYNNHICSGCIMFTSAGLNVVKFDLDNGFRPTCFSIGKSLAIANLEYGNVDQIARIEHANFNTEVK